jgi:uncharacterized protein YlxP (DUF503 family)
MASKFYVGQCIFDLHVANSHSLKEKRRVIKSLKEKLKNRFNVAICEFGDLSLWQRSQICIVTCSNDHAMVDSTIRMVINFLERVHSVALLDIKQGII